MLAQRPTVETVSAASPAPAASTIDYVMSDAASTLDRAGAFPPLTPRDFALLAPGQPTALTPDATRMVYDVCWYLVKDERTALDLTVVTFRIAVQRFHEHALPTPEAYTAWLASIASNEAHRALEENRSLKPSSPLLEDGPDRDAHYLADTLAELRADHKLALLLRYRYDTPAKYLSFALDLRPRKVADLLVKARADFAANSSIQPSVLADANPPLQADLPLVVEPYSKKEMRRKVLGYDWLGSDFPVIPEREERRARWVTLALTAFIIATVSVIVTRPWSAERPVLVDPNPVVESIDGQ